MYELKPECAKEFNLYFYHFSRAEQSKVIGKIKKYIGKGLLGVFLVLFFPKQLVLLFTQIEKGHIFIVENLENMERYKEESTDYL